MRYYIYIIFLLLSLPARAELASLFGSGTVSQSMGGASLLQGKSSAQQVYSSPAALGYVRKMEASVGAQYFDPKIRPFGTIVLNSNGTTGEFKSSGVLPGAGQQISLALPIGQQRPLTLGVSFYLPFSTLVRVSGSPVNYPFYPLYNDISRNFFFVLGAGYEIFDGLALGLNFKSTTKSNTVYILKSDNSVNYSASAVEATSESRISISLLYDFERVNAELPFTIGAMYRAKSGMETKLSADITAFVPVQGVLVSTPSFTPAEWALMGSARVGTLSLSADVAWVKWSKYSSPYGSGNINSYVIGSNQKSASFKDILVSKVGADWKRGKFLGATESHIRMGYQYHPSPVPDQVSDANFVDNSRHLFSTGLGLVFQDPWHSESKIDLDTFFQYNWLVVRDVKKNLSTNIGAPGYRTGGKILLYGMSATVRF